MLSFSFSNEQEYFQKMLREISLNELLSQYTKWDREHPLHLWKKLGELGVNGLHLPEEYGGRQCRVCSSGNCC